MSALTKEQLKILIRDLDDASLRHGATVPGVVTADTLRTLVEMAQEYLKLQERVVSQNEQRSRHLQETADMWSAERKRRLSAEQIAGELAVDSRHASPWQTVAFKHWEGHRIRWPEGT